MQRVILHLTDLHFGCDGRDPNRLAERKLCLDGLVKTIVGLEADWRPNMICISGDLGWAGRKTDYDEAEEWLNTLIGELGISYGSVVICPGNHDLDRKYTKYAYPRDASEADRLLELPEEGTCPVEEFYAKPFAQFEAFCRRVGTIPLTIGDRSSYLVGSCQIGGVRIVSLNSAWFARDNDRSCLWIGRPHLAALAAREQTYEVHTAQSEYVTVAMMHHPREWLHENEIHTWGARWDPHHHVASRCHVLLTGHTHNRPSQPDFLAPGAWHFSCGSAYAGAYHFNAFCLLRVGGRTPDYRYYEFDPGRSPHHWCKCEEGKIPFVPHAMLAEAVSRQQGAFSRASAGETTPRPVPSTTPPVSMVGESSRDTMNQLLAANGDVMSVIARDPISSDKLNPNMLGLVAELSAGLSLRDIGPFAETSNQPSAEQANELATRYIQDVRTAMATWQMGDAERVAHSLDKLLGAGTVDLSLQVEGWGVLGMYWLTRADSSPSAGRAEMEIRAESFLRKAAAAYAQIES